MCLYLVLKREVERKVRGVRVNGEGGGSQGGKEIEASSFFRRAQDVPLHLKCMERIRFASFQKDYASVREVR